jgi:hypothetical protein
MVKWRNLHFALNLREFCLQVNTSINCVKLSFDIENNKYGERAKLYGYVYGTGRTQNI